MFSLPYNYYLATTKIRHFLRIKSANVSAFNSLSAAILHKNYSQEISLSQNSVMIATWSNDHASLDFKMKLQNITHRFLSRIPAQSIVWWIRSTNSSKTLNISIPFTDTTSYCFSSRVVMGRSQKIFEAWGEKPQKILRRLDEVPQKVRYLHSWGNRPLWAQSFQ